MTTRRKALALRQEIDGFVADCRRRELAKARRCGSCLHSLSVALVCSLLWVSRDKWLPSKAGESGWPFQAGASSGHQSLADLVLRKLGPPVNYTISPEIADPADECGTQPRDGRTWPGRSRFTIPREPSAHSSSTAARSYWSRSGERAARRVLLELPELEHLVEPVRAE